MLRKSLVPSLIVLAIVLACVLLFCAQVDGLSHLAYLYICVAGEQMAYDLVPLYPGSESIASESKSQNNSGTERRKYQTPGSIDSVLAFMRQQLPDQTISKQGDTYSLHVIDHSWLSDLAMPIAYNDPYRPDFTDLPQADIQIYQSNESGNETVIEIRFYWPSW